MKTFKYPKIISAMEKAECGEMVLCEPQKTSEFERERMETGYDPGGIDWVNYYLESVEDGCGVYETILGKRKHTIVVRPAPKLKGYFKLARDEQD